MGRELGREQHQGAHLPYVSDFSTDTVSKFIAVPFSVCYQMQKPPIKRKVEKKKSFQVWQVILQK